MKSPVTHSVAKVPVIMQMESLECGAACLAMIMAHYGLWLPLEQLRKECGVSRDGSNLRSIYLVAERYGLSPEAFRYSAEQLREKGAFPCIAFWEYNHFVVVDGFRGDYVVLNDPAHGLVKMKFDEFSRSYSGVCMILTPSESFTPSGQPESILKFALERMKGTLTIFLLIILTTIITLLTGILTPAFSRFFVDNVLTREFAQWNRVFFGALFVVMCCHVAAVMTRNIYLLKLQGKMSIVAGTSFLWHVLRLPVEFFTQRTAGDIVQRQRSNAKIADTIINSFAPLVTDTASMMFNLLLMINYSPLIASIGVVSIVLNLIIARAISERCTNITRVQMREEARLDGATLSGIDMIETIKAAGAENEFFARWAGFQASHNEQAVKYAEINQFYGQIPGLLYLLAANIILFLGVRLIMRGEWTIGMITAFNGYFSAFSLPAMSLINSGQAVREMRAPPMFTTQRRKQTQRVSIAPFTTQQHTRTMTPTTLLQPPKTSRN